MKIIDCQQGTEEWFKARLGVATASNFSKIVDSKGSLSKQWSDYSFTLASETLTIEKEESYKSFEMDRGNELEPYAIQEYKEMLLNDVELCGFVSCGDYGCSPDGLVGKSGVVEVKSPNQKTHTKYMYDNKLPTAYKAQVQGNLLCLEREWCDFISYNPTFRDKKIFVKRIYRDEEYIKVLREGIQKVIDKKNAILESLVIKE